MDENIVNMRRDYRRSGLYEQNVPEIPSMLFEQWFAEAKQVEQSPIEVNAMMLATVDGQGHPHCRVLLLKALDERGFTFFTNYQSAKAVQISTCRHVAMTFFWPTSERQIRIEGLIEQVSRQESEQYFNQRPLGSRLSAWASPQSQVVANRAALEELLKTTEERFVEKAPVCPEHWGGYRLVPEYLEFWQGRANRLHDRISYRLEEGGWSRQRLAP